MKRQLEELSAQYNLKVKRVEYSRSNYHLETTSGMYMLRKVIVPTEQIEFEYEVSSFLKENNFEQMNVLYLNKKDIPYATYHDKVYVLQDYKKYEEVDFKDLEDLKQIVRLLAKFHKQARGMKSQHRNIERAGMKNVYEYFSKRYAESQRLKKNISKCASKTSFEWAFMKGYKAYEELEEYALACIDMESCEEIIKEARNNLTLTHNDYNYHSVNKSKRFGYFINNFDYCTYNIQIIDLATTLTKVMQKNNWNIHILDVLMEEYNKEKSLSDKEIGILKAMLIFPEKYASICQKYLNTKRRANYSVFDVKWNNMIDYQQHQVNAANKIKGYL